SLSGATLVPLCSFIGAISVGALVFRLAAAGGHVSIPALLLIGLAMNTFLGGVLQLLQMVALGDTEVTRGLLSWLFGTLVDRQSWHAAVVWIVLVPALACIPSLAWELDLMQSGLEDAQSLGVDTRMVTRLALVAASASAAAAVSVAGQIAFVGL